jgi:hypothetical protein
MSSAASARSCSPYLTTPPGVAWDKAVQRANMVAIIAAQKNVLYETPKPRFFVYQSCCFLDSQRSAQNAISVERASD